MVNKIKQQLTIVFALCLTTSLFSQNLSDKFPLKWKTKVGFVNYRSNIQFVNGSIFVPSNGLSRESIDDKLDGVHQIDPKTGKIIHTFSLPYLGDNNVAAFCISGDKLFFGTDNSTAVCFDLKTKEELWKISTIYDVESAPAAADFNQDGSVDFFFSVENYGFYTVDGKTGDFIWINDSISSHSGNVPGRLYDINNDGVLDIITAGRGAMNTNETAGFKMAHYGDYVLAFDGKTGEILWSNDSGAGIHTKPLIFKQNGEDKIAVLDAYGEFQVIDMNGITDYSTGYGYDQYSSPIFTSTNRLIVGTTSILLTPKAISYDSTYNRSYINPKLVDLKRIEIEGDIIATPVVADLYGTGKQQVINVTKNGQLFTMNTDGTNPKIYKLPGKGAEASLFVKDIDGDGKLELLLADLDGYLYCFGTNSKGKVEIEGFGVK